MIPMDLSNYQAEIVTESGGAGDAVIRTTLSDGGLQLWLRADESRPCYVRLRWAAPMEPAWQVLGDAWERSYGDLQFLPLGEQRRQMPWYFLITDGRTHLCMGVKTQPNAFVSFACDPQGVTATVDCRNGGAGVALGGRELHCATFLTACYADGNAFDALQDFCRRMCPQPLLPNTPVCGNNNWYYAYGNSSREEILADATLTAALADGLPDPAYEVIDDGWQRNGCAGPWLPNEKFGDMETLAAEIHAKGLRAGLWMRPLCTKDAVPADWRLRRSADPTLLDPTHPAVQALIRDDLRRIAGWGFDLVKHDYSTVDLFGNWGKDCPERITQEAAWHFYDPTKTNAEITLNLYRLIRESCGEMLIIGCNTVSHLCAGLAEINRTGDDTSGKDWARTRKMGVNTLAFRLAQNRAFYLVDADCVGIAGEAIPWANNRQWLQLLSLSDTALFVSCTDQINPQMRADIAAAFRTLQQPHGLEPLDWMQTPTPRHWLADGAPQTFDWADAE